MIETRVLYELPVNYFIAARKSKKKLNEGG